MKRINLMAGLVVSLALFGCSSDNKAKMNMSESDAAQMDSNHATIKDAAAPNLSANTHFAAGQVAESGNNADAAIKQYTAALKLDPNHLPSLYRLGVVYAELRRFDDAIDIWKRYVKATNYAASSYNNLAFCYEVSGHADEAEAQYLAGIQKDHLNLACRTNYGLMLVRHDRLAEAMKVWEPVLTQAEIHYNLASLYESSGRKREARIEYRKALDLDPKLTDAKSRLTQLDMR